MSDDASNRKDAEAQFEEAALGHFDAVFRFSMYLSGNEVYAEDLTQDAFLQAFRKYHLFRHGTDMKAWLFRITRNLYIDQFRRKRLAPQVSDLSDVAVGGENPSGETESSETTLLKDPLRAAGPLAELTGEEEAHLYERFGDEVGKSLNELPPTFRLSLLLCDVEGMSYEDIGAALGCPIGTVRSRISRARQHLRERLYDYARELGFTRGTPEST